MSNKVLDGIMGLAVADALGVPVEFQSRQNLLEEPVTDMRAYGTYNQPAGTWSDDTSMTLALVESLIDGLNYHDIMDNFLRWFEESAFTPHGEVFDIGITTRASLLRYKQSTEPLVSGGANEGDNGNGSLMRILPIVFYLPPFSGKDSQEQEMLFQVIHNISNLTHRHKRSHIACGIYCAIASNLLYSPTLESAIRSGIYTAMDFYEDKEGYQEELNYFSRLVDQDFKNLLVEEINSSGYVVDTLEAAIWCLLNTKNYKSCVLKAVNLGQDTDTVAAVAGGLAGLKYGIEGIPDEWRETLVKKEYIETLSNKLYRSITKRSVDKLTKYIPYFEEATSENVEVVKKEDVLTPYFNYEDTFFEFIDDVYETNLMHGDYLAVIERELERVEHIEDAIWTADLEVLSAILTSLVRQERFVTGLWSNAIEDKTFLKILHRFQELVK